jgi:peptidoglycan/xylan/chitin deacetylase (PgdA/CDA1 family)
MPVGRHVNKRLLKLSISVLFLAGDRLWEAARLLVGREARSTYVVVYYHSISAAEKWRFARQMEMLARLTKPVRLGEPLQCEPGARYSSVTFDDVFANVLEHAIPELQQRHIPAVLFVTTGKMGQKAEWWPAGTCEREEYLLSGVHLSQLPEDIVTIGSHSVSHPKFPSLPEASARQELLESRDALERTLGRKITFFSFPYGAFNESTIELCRQTGYGRVFTTIPVLAVAQGEFVTGRIGVDPADWSCEFRLKLLGAYRWLPYAFSLKRKVLSVLNRADRRVPE